MKRDIQQVGQCSYWHNLPGYQDEEWGGSLKSRAQALASYFYNNRDIGFESPDSIQLKGMAVELCQALSQTGEGAPNEFIHLLADLMDLPQEFGKDLQDFYSGYYGKHPRSWSRDKFELALHYEADHYRRFTKWPKAAAVAHHAGVSEETIRKQWRRDPEYSAFRAFIENR